MSKPIIISNINNIKGDIDSLQNNKVDKVSGKGLSDNNYTDQEVSKVSNLPSDTNNELNLLKDSWINFNQNYRPKIQNLPPNTMSKIQDLQDGKVDRVTGKGLSTNDYTNPDRSKVSYLPSNTGSEISSLDSRTSTLEGDVHDIEVNLSGLAGELSQTQASLGDMDTELEEVNEQLAQTAQLLDDITATIGEPWEVS